MPAGITKHIESDCLEYSSQGWIWYQTALKLLLRCPIRVLGYIFIIGCTGGSSRDLLISAKEKIYVLKVCIPFSANSFLLHKY